MALAELIRELELATGPDRNLDTKIAFAVRFKSNNPTAGEVPRYTSDLNAAVKLAREIAPASVGGFAWLANNSCTARLDSDQPAIGANGAIALCCSALKRKIAEEERQTELLKRSGQNYRALFKSHPVGSSVLLVVMSEHQSFMMARHDFDAHVLHLFEQKNCYYTFELDYLIQDVTELAHRLGVAEIIFAGSSKAGYGAIAAGRLFDSPEIKVRTVAFSPVTQVYPREKQLSFVTYRMFLKLIEENNSVRESAERFGRLLHRPQSDAYREQIFYGQYCAFDRNELVNLAGTSLDPNSFLSIGAIPASTHNVITLIAAKKADHMSFTSSTLAGADHFDLPWLERDNEVFLSESSKIYDALQGTTINNVLGINSRD